MVPQMQEETRQRTCTVYKTIMQQNQCERTVMVSDTKMVERKYTVCIPETRQEVRQYTALVPEVREETRQRTVPRTATFQKFIPARSCAAWRSVCRFAILAPACVLRMPDGADPAECDLYRQPLCSRRACGELQGARLFLPARDKIGHGARVHWRKEVRTELVP